MRKLRKRSIEMFYFAALPINPYKKTFKDKQSKVPCRQRNDQ